MKPLRALRRKGRGPQARAAPPIDAKVSVEAFGALVTIAGELDMSTTPQVQAALSSPEVAGAGGVVVDLSGVTFMDSTGLGMFLGLQRELSARGTRLAVACPDGPARLVFDVAGVDGQLQLHYTRGAAEAAVVRPL